MKTALLGLILFMGLLAATAKADVPAGVACPPTEGYALLCFKYHACIMGDCSSWEFEGEQNDSWLDDYWNPSVYDNNFGFEVSRELPL